MNIYVNRVKRQTAQTYYIGTHQFNGKKVCVLSGGKIWNFDGNFQIFAAVQGRWLMSVINVTEVNECPKADYYYLCD